MVLFDADEESDAAILSTTDWLKSSVLSFVDTRNNCPDSGQDSPPLTVLLMATKMMVQVYI